MERTGALDFTAAVLGWNGTKCDFFPSQICAHRVWCINSWTAGQVGRLKGVLSYPFYFPLGTRWQFTDIPELVWDFLFASLGYWADHLRQE